ncbi:MAG: ISC system 2Fe-2S type ferredoxin [Sutterellaceae bacterium]|nr:ISC system 2Fe-2S type ferredoxin [Sutterellaceae bacterium]MDD7441981.1 ISC system 2Fe-2S type ferredoxin [Sutterellaceae bacterium]MDY2867817.1 ISC system 2Fe-2S type ferredoxin [Mesosutterella sp.]
MPKITVLPHPKYCPEGAEFEMQPGENLIRGMLAHGVKIEHACEMSCACATCHVIVRKGFDSLEEPSDREFDCLDRAWGVGPLSRLSCQVKIGTEDLTIELPKYTRNQVSEDD